MASDKKSEKSQQNSLFISSFSSLSDPRRTHKGNYFYPLHEILFLSISAVISGADGWTTINEFGKTKLKWLRKFFPYENGVPSHDVLGKLFARIDNKEFTKCFSEWINSISKITDGEVVAIDGKTIKKSNTSKSALHVVSAYASGNMLCLGQEVVDEKSNEIIAIPKLLKLLEIKGCIVTIDAMGCQKKIAKEIIRQKADYLLMVKGNQQGLQEQVKKLFDKGSFSDQNTEIESGHGRVETRTCHVITDLTFLDGKEEWKDLKSIACVTSERFDKKTGKTSTEKRYYISSLVGKAMQINNAVRKHWTVENNLHWSLDVIFKEDFSLKKKGNSAINFNIILKLALAMLENEKSRKISKPAKRLAAALNDEYREKIIYS